MSLQCRRLTLLICSLSLTLCSLSYLFIMISLCQFNLYNIVFIINICIIGGVGTIYFAKLLFIGDSCCKWLAIIGILLAIGCIIGLILTKHDIISDYGIGFHDRCQILTTSYLCGSLILLITIIITSMLCIIPSTYEEV